MCLTEDLSHNLERTVKYNQTTESRMPLSDGFLSMKMFCKIKVEPKFKLPARSRGGFFEQKQEE